MILKYLKINLILFKNAFIRDLKIPGFVFSATIVRIIEIIVSIIFFNVLFSFTDNLAGWNYYQILFLYSFVRFINLIHSGWLKAGIKSIATEMIRRGDLDFYLTKPVDTMFLVSINRPRIYVFINLFFIVGVGIWAVAKGQMALGWENVLWFIILTILSLILYYYLTILTVIPAFWFIRLWSLQDIMNRMNTFMRYPAGIFPISIRIALFTIFPILAVSYIPVASFFEPPKISYIIYMIITTIVFSLLTRFFWQLGEKHYGSASS